MIQAMEFIRPNRIDCPVRYAAQPTIAAIEAMRSRQRDKDASFEAAATNSSCGYQPATRS